MRKRSGSGSLALALALVAGLPALAGELPENFRLEAVVTGLTEPSALAFTPDQRVLIAERTTGSLRVLQGGQLQATPLCSVSVNATGEGGLLGVAVHPAFNANGWVYLYFTDLTSGRNRVTRFTVRGSACSDPLVILPDLGAGPGLLRNGGGMAFGTDGKLYVATGDVEVQANGQDAGVLPGKVLRVNDNGSVPSDNPTPGSLVYAVGVRDGRGVSVTAAGVVYVADHGNTAASDHDEVHRVVAGGNLGWADETGPGGVHDAPLVAWLPTVGIHGLARYGGSRFPDQIADGVDNDHDRFGPDRMPGKRRADDNFVGICVGGTNNENPCTTVADCPPRAGEAAVYCGGIDPTGRDRVDDMAEWCPGGVPVFDDGCLGSTGPRGVDEPDESYVGNLFAAGTEVLQRAVLTGSTLSVSSTFLDSTPPLEPTPPPPNVTDCPVGWTGVATGGDGFMYAVARNTGGATGGLYRVIHDAEPGPREVSPPGSPFPLMMAKGVSPSDVVLHWEDLREDATQPRDNGTDPLPAVREYTIWRGTIGSYYSHNPIPGFEAIQGAAVNSALRSETIGVGSGNEYFVVSARHANFEGSLGRASSGTERPGFAAADRCPAIGFYSPGGALWTCGQDFTLRDEFGVWQSLSEYRGKVVLFDLSAEWCGPCHSQANIMEGLYLDFKDRGVAMLTVLMDEWNQTADYNGRPTPTSCRDWADRAAPNLDHTFECWVDPNPGSGQTAWPQYGTGFLPTNIIIDQGGRVVYVAAGYNETAIRAKLDALVGAGDTCLP